MKYSDDGFYEPLSEADLFDMTSERLNRVTVGVRLAELMKRNPELKDLGIEDATLIGTGVEMYGFEIDSITSEQFAKNVASLLTEIALLETTE